MTYSTRMAYANLIVNDNSVHGLDNGNYESSMVTAYSTNPVKDQYITDRDAIDTMQEVENNGCKWSKSEIYLVMIVTQLGDHLK